MNIQTSLPQYPVVLDTERSTLGFHDLQTTHIARGKPLVLHTKNDALPDVEVTLFGMALYEERDKVALEDSELVRSDRRWILFGRLKNEPDKVVEIVWEGHRMVSLVWANV